jgi:hypothetical protein
MDEEGFKRVRKLCVGIILVTSIFQVLPNTDLMMGVASADSQWILDDEADFLQGTFDNAALYGSGPSAQIGLKLNNTGRWVLKSPPSQPDGRRGHVISSIYGTDKVLLFGGYDGNYFNDTWVYDLSDDEWTNMEPTGVKPSARHSLAMSFIHGTDKILLFGGMSQSFLTNETWLYDFSDNTWESLLLTNSPTVREYHEIEPVYNDDKVILFSGYDGSDYIDDTWIFDLSDKEWRPMAPLTGPSARKGHEMATFYGTDEILLFGGNESGISVVDDTWIYDLSIDNWTNKDPGAGKPIPRRGHGMGGFYNTDLVLLFGPDDETWIYDLSENTWTPQPTTIQPNPRAVTHSIAPIFNDDKIVLFGGWRNNSGNWIHYNDTWVYDLTSYEEQGTFLSSPYNIGSNASLKTISWFANKPAGTNIKFQIRSASSQSALTGKNFVGPDGTQGIYYTNSFGETIWSGHEGDSWVQYKIYLTGTPDVTPKVNSVSVYYNHMPLAPQIISPENDVWIVDNTPEFTWSFLDSDSLQGGFQVLIDDDEAFLSIDFDSGMQSSSNHFWQFEDGTSYNEIPDGAWFLKVRTQDSDGGLGPYSASSVFKIDTIEPVSSVTTPVNNGFYKSISGISGSASDYGGIGIDVVNISLMRVFDGNFWTGSSWEPGESWLSVTGSEIWEYDAVSVIFESGLQYKVKSRAIDLAQHQENEIEEIMFTIDSDAPSVLINPQIDMIYLTDLDIITGSAEDKNGAGVDFVELNIIRNSDNLYWDGTTWKEEVIWLSAIGNNQWSCDLKNVDLSENSRYTISARATDKVGNTGISHEASFIIDTMAPKDLFISINNGDTFTEDKDVILLLYAQDSGSRVERMSFSSDGIIWSVWEDYSVTKSYSLSSGDGQKTIYYRVKDHVGNIGGPVFETIILDALEPVLDSDGDGEPNYADIDDDNDGLSDFDEVVLGTDPLLIDTDGDNYNDLEDAYPLDPTMHAKDISEPEERTYDTYWFLMVPLIAIILLLVFLFVIWRNRKKGQELRINLLKKFK